MCNEKRRTWGKEDVSLNCELKGANEEKGQGEEDASLYCELKGAGEEKGQGKEDASLYCDLKGAREEKGKGEEDALSFKPIKVLNLYMEQYFILYTLYLIPHALHCQRYESHRNINGLPVNKSSSFRILCVR